jgi:nucleotide-binding universal stress UspA family protein
MIDVRRVLAAVDFSESSRRALDYAIAIAKWYGSPLTVLHVRTAAAPPVAPLPVLVPSAAEGLIASASEQEHWRHQLEAFVPAQARKDIRVDCTVTEGDVATEILAETQPSDLIVIGTHSRSGFEHLVLGSVAEEILLAAPGALLTIPPRAPDATYGVPRLFHHVVAAVDFSATSMHALEHALALAEEADAQLTLLHVVHMPEQPALWIDRGDRASVVNELQETARDRLAALVPDVLRRYCHVAVRVEAGEPACEIVRVASEDGAGLVVLGAHSRGIAERMFVGSTAQQVVRHATFPVLTVRATSKTEESDQV